MTHCPRTKRYVDLEQNLLLNPSRVTAYMYHSFPKIRKWLHICSFFLYEYGIIFVHCGPVLVLDMVIQLWTSPCFIA